jgi:DNA invertase Pin-like site-specific DNA recombinase
VRIPALGYATTAGEERGSDAQVNEQTLAIVAACDRLGLELIDVVRDREPDAGAADARPGLRGALERIETGEASCLVVTALDCLGTQVAEFASVVDRLEKRGTRLIALDVGLDTADAPGHLAVARRPRRRLPWMPEPEPEEQPAAPVEERVAPEAEPVTAEAEPVAREAEPVTPEAEPVAREAEPVAPEAEPVTAEAEPVAREAEPVTPEAKPVTPAAEQAAPHTEPPAPAAEQAAAAAEQVAPEAEQVAPETEAAPPDAEPVAPGAEVGPPEAEAAGGAAEPAPAAPVVPMRALGYASAAASGDVGAEDLEAQRKAIERSCADHACELVEVVADREPKDGKAFDRPGLSHALERIAAGDASCVIVAGLERVSRSVAELGTLVHWLEENGIRLVAVDIDLDTASPAGRGTARALASVAEMERGRISERTRKGLAAARAKRHATGDPSATDWAALRKRIAGMRADGMTLQAIANVLNEEGVPTQRGGAKWRPSSVQTAAGYKRRTRARGIEDLPRKPPTDRP